jgi:hypothetical protein
VLKEYKEKYGFHCGLVRHEFSNLVTGITLTLSTSKPTIRFSNR